VSIETSIVITTRFPRDEHADIVQIAAKHGMTLSEIVRFATRQIMDAERRQPGKYLRVHLGRMKYARA
jgi:uncharacterized protein YdbL (DUF1318 family)